MADQPRPRFTPATEADLARIYKRPAQAIRDKAFDHLDVHSRRYIELSPFFCIGSFRNDGLGDVSPRGGEPGFVHALDVRHVAFPDRPGNNRLDTLLNLVHNPAVGLLFFLPGVSEMLRLNGLAAITTETSLMERFVHAGKPPRSVVVIEIKEVYFHCAKAITRSGLWDPARQLPKGSFPSLGQIAKDQYKLIFPSGLLDFALRRDTKKNLY